MRSLIVALSISTLLLTACGSPSGGGDGSGQGQTRTVTVNGKSPVDYFNQFLYRVSGSCRPDTIYFHYGLIDGIVLPDSGDSKPMRAEMSLYLLAGQNYVVKYEEHKVRYFVGGGYGYDVVFKNEIQGKWSVNRDGHLVIDGIGIGQAINYNDRETVHLTFTRDLNTKGLAGRTSLMRMVMSSSGGLVDYREYCLRQ